SSHVPEQDQTSIVARSERLAVGAESETRQGARMLEGLTDELQRRGVPESHPVVNAARREPTSIRAEHERLHAAAGRIERLRYREWCSPYPNPVIRSPSHERTAIRAESQRRYFADVDWQRQSSFVVARRVEHTDRSARFGSIGSDRGRSNRDPWTISRYSQAAGAHIQLLDE